MKKRFKIAAAVCALAFLCAFAVGCNGGKKPEDEQPRVVRYHFASDAQAGGDGSSGSPFSSLDKISELDLKAGDEVCLKAGSVFKGSLVLKNISGNTGNPVRVTSYGDTEKDGLPKIDGDGATGSGVLYIENCSNVEVKDLELYDSAKEEGDRRGVLVNAKNESGSGEVGTYENIVLDGLYVHDIRGYTDKANSGMSLQSKRTGGIHVWSEDGYGRFDGLTIKNCRIDNVDNVGIATWRIPSTGAGKISPYSEDFDKFSHANVLISGNEISHIGKNAIFARNLKGGFIEHNVMYETATVCVSGNTICTSYVYGTVVQFNEGYFNRAKARPSDGKLQDGCMLDADLQSRDTIWQYNYSHDNAFGLFLNCTSYAPGSGVEDRAIVRYNLSVHDHGNVGIVYINYVSAGIEIYNNTFVISEQTAPTVLKSNSGRKFSFYNNIIYNMSEQAKFAIADTSGVKIDNNLVYNAGGADIEGLDGFKLLNESGIYEDPLFVKEYSDSLERVGRNFADTFRLKGGSPALSAGREIAALPTDFFGNDYARSIGFCNK